MTAIEPKISLLPRITLNFPFLSSPFQVCRLRRRRRLRRRARGRRGRSGRRAA